MHPCETPVHVTVVRGFSKNDLVDPEGRLSNPAPVSKTAGQQGFSAVILPSSKSSGRPIEELLGDPEHWFEEKGRLSNPRSDLYRAVDLIMGELESIGYVLGSGRVVEGPWRQRRVQTRLSEAEIDQLVAAYEGGASVPAVARQFGVHWCTALKHLEKRGVPRRGHTRMMNDEQVEEARLMKKIGVSYTEIALKYGVSEKTVRREIGRGLGR